VVESVDRDRHSSQLDPAVARAFGVSPDITLLTEGSDQKTFRSGDVVLRFLGDFAAEAGNWNADVFDRLEQHGFRVTKPRRAANGAWVVNGWVAEEFLIGQSVTLQDIPQAIDGITAFHQALIGTPLPEYRKHAHTLWDRADEGAWGDIPERIDPRLYALASRLAILRTPVHLPDQLIHGDLNPDNILVADQVPPAIIDLAPYWRPAPLASAVLAYWIGPYRGNAAILEHFRGIPAFDQMLIRAGLWKALSQRDLGQPTHLEQHAQAVGIIENFVTGHR
jgi:uncharacterized protein (TIGR02569 family)